MNNGDIIQTLNYDKKVMAEEVLHKNPCAKILPTQPLPDELPPKESMISVFHRNCDGGLAFYYTHVPESGEMMTASRSRDIDGNDIEPGAPMICGSCKAPCEPGRLFVSKIDYEIANHA